MIGQGPSVPARSTRAGEPHQRAPGRFSAMFLNYDLLSRRSVQYAALYTFLKGSAGILMLADRRMWQSVPVALFIGTEGAVSVFKAFMSTAANSSTPASADHRTIRSASCR